MRTALDTMRQELQEIKKTRLSLKDKIRSTQIKRDQEKLSDEKNLLNERYERLKNIDPEKAEKARREKYVLEQRIALNDLSLSTDVYRAKERNYRLELIRQMTGGAWPSQDWINKQLQKIEEAHKIRITQKEYDRSKTEERGIQQGRKITPDYESGRGGYRKRMEDLPEEEQINLEKASFSALVYQFQIDIASVTQAARQIIYETGEKNKGTGKKILNVKCKEIIDSISEAIRKKNREALYIAQNKLKVFVNDELSRRKDFLKKYIEIIRLEPHFRKVLENIKELTKKNMPPKLDNSGNLIVANFDDKDKDVLIYILNDIHRLKLICEKYQQQIGTRFKRVIEDMNRITVYINKYMSIYKPENKQFYPERSPLAKEIARKQTEEAEKKLKNNSIAYRIQLLKIAQVTIPEQEINKTTADQLANEIFNKIFDEAYQKMLSELAA
jgi:hypothetical protein